MRGPSRAVGGGRGPCDCTNISIMQLFHELKQQFPAIPDESVTACITDNCHDRSACRDRLQRELQQLPRALAYPPSLMGARMTESAHRLDNNERARPSAFPSPLFPSHHNTSVVSATSTRTPPRTPDCEQPPPGKPPISPSSNKRFGVTKNSPTKSKNFLTKLEEESSLPNCFLPNNEIYNNTNLGAVKKPPAVRPASLDLTNQPQQTDPQQSNSVLSVNVNCSVDVLATPPRVRKHTSLQITPEPVWCQQNNNSPRSFTSVNLTLRTPTSEPLPPIDICSANSSLTYSTSSFNSKQGLQSRLQITVGPGGGNVTSIRSRPSSSYHPEPEVFNPISTRAGSMPDLATTNTTPTQTMDIKKTMKLVNRQLERKEQMKKELEAGRERLISIQKEIEYLRIKNTPEFRDQLKREIRHLQGQCDRLTHDVDRHSESRVPLGETNVEFYRNIYNGQRNSFRPPQVQTDGPVRHQNEQSEIDEPRWPCDICTFRNHPLMNKCEQCEMPRILLVSAVPGDNIHIRFATGNTRSKLGCKIENKIAYIITKTPVHQFLKAIT